MRDPFPSHPPSLHGSSPWSPGPRAQPLLLSQVVTGAILGIALMGALPAAPAGAQQYVVDDAAIVDPNACQVEAWHGERSSWILPACQLLGNVEISAGVGFLDEGEGLRETEYAVEAKTLSLIHI